MFLCLFTLQNVILFYRISFFLLLQINIIVLSFIKRFIKFPQLSSNEVKKQNRDKWLNNLNVHNFFFNQRFWKGFKITVRLRQYHRFYWTLSFMQITTFYYPSQHYKNAYSQSFKSRIRNHFILKKNIQCYLIDLYSQFYAQYHFPVLQLRQ